MIHIYKTSFGVVVRYQDKYKTSTNWDWNTFINRKNLHSCILDDLSASDVVEATEVESRICAPVDRQEVWASGVTYLRSREARMEESKDAGGGDFYSRVYDAERPELFFKSTPERVKGHHEPVRIRRDSAWNVPEPELTLFICSSGSIEGYTIGNDMSSRDIEGENPLYLPQAKSYDGATALGPCIYVPESPISQQAEIKLEICRNEETVFLGTILIDRMKRSHAELAAYLFREMSFPYGVYLMTGTGIVPPDGFTLTEGDLIKISISGIGELINYVKS